jgi:NAD(P)-dependent dehydrogenase (short-subunit alcohol dehydrogenase family)
LDPFSKLGADPSHLTDDLVRTFTTNVVGNIHLFNLFMPLILKGDAKKVISISSGMADNDLVTKFGIYEAGPYTLSKSAMNMVMSKFQSEYEKDGVLFLSVSPGLVDTENGGESECMRATDCESGLTERQWMRYKRRRLWVLWQSSWSMRRILRAPQSLRMRLGMS